MSISKEQAAEAIQGLTLDLVKVFAPNFPEALQEVADQSGRTFTMTFTAEPYGDGQVKINTELGAKVKVIDAEVVTE